MDVLGENILSLSGFRKNLRFQAVLTLWNTNSVENCAILGVYERFAKMLRIGRNPA